MQYTRLLKFGMQGADVRYMKDCLFALGYYDDTIREIRKDSFGEDTRRAVLRFQRTNRDDRGRPLADDGIIGPLTWNAVERAMPKPEPITLPATIGREARTAIQDDLSGAEPMQSRIVSLALPYAYDPSAGGRQYPFSLYIRGENLFGRDLEQVRITRERVEDGARKQPQYYNGGRKEMMLEAVKDNPRISGADCSGGIVGLLRKLGLTEASFDTTANLLCGNAYSKRRTKDALRPGDFVGRPEHIGLYAGGGYVIEWMGGAYGCQLSRLDERQGYNFVRKRMEAKSGWTKFRAPLFY